MKNFFIFIPNSNNNHNMFVAIYVCTQESYEFVWKSWAKGATKKSFSRIILNIVVDGGIREEGRGRRLVGLKYGIKMILNWYECIFVARVFEWCLFQ